MAQTTVHGIADYMASSKDLPEGARVIMAAPNLALNKDTKPSEAVDIPALANYMFMWANAEAGVPANGTFVGIKNDKGVAIPEML